VTADPSSTRETTRDVSLGSTGDEAVDEAVGELVATDPDDLDAQISAGERVHHTLRTRLSDLGG
jgi:hypothetical protein